jgi:hypothetical protein
MDPNSPRSPRGWVSCRTATAWTATAIRAGRHLIHIHRLVADGTLTAAHRTDDGLGPAHRGTGLVEAVTEGPGKRAYVVTGDGDTAVEEQVEPRRLPGV